MKISNLRTIPFFIILIILIVASAWFAFNSTDKRLKRFYDDFGFSLPKDTSVIFYENNFGWFSDGEYLIVYQLSEKGMQEFVNNPAIKSWSKLPVTTEIKWELHKKAGYSSAEIARIMKSDRQEGYYKLIDRYMSYNPEMKAQLDYNTYKYNNFTVGIIDFKDNRIIVYMYNS